MKITYIHHSSFLVEMEQAALLFDYFEGKVPEIEADKPLIVFASHRHSDHFSAEIFRLAEKHPKIWYVLSDDIWKQRVPKPWLERTCFVGPKTELSLMENVGLPVVIRTLASTDEGVAFLIEAEGKRIFHAGDLNNWVWEGEPEEENRRMSQRFHREMNSISGVHIDVAFMLLDPRQDNDFYLGMDDFMRMVGADTVFPMHFWGDFAVTERFKQLPCAAGYKDKIIPIHSCGESFEI